ncbi:MAG: hypothetical protein WB709_08310 [Solirubrobacteraceae bacterium]
MPATGKSSSGIKRKRASVSSSPKPPAKTARKTPRTARSAKKGRFKSGWEKNVADRWVIHQRLMERLPWSEIVERDGRSERALRAVVDDYLEHVQEGDAVRPLEQDPIDLLAATLDRLGIMRDTMVGLMQSTENELVIVAAAREWRHVEKELRDLMIAVGVLPRDLWKLRHVIEAREAADILDGLLDDLEDGSLTAQQVRARIAEWAGVKPVIESSPLEQAAA